MSNTDLHICQELPVPDHTAFKVARNGVHIPLPVINQESFKKSYYVWVAKPEDPPCYAWYNIPGYTCTIDRINTLSSNDKQAIVKLIMKSIKSGKSIQTVHNNITQLIHLIVNHLDKYHADLGMSKPIKEIFKVPHGFMSFVSTLFRFPPMDGVDMKRVWELIERNTADGYAQWFSEHEAPWIHAEYIPNMSIADRFFILTRFYANPRSAYCGDSTTYEYLMSNMHRGVYIQRRYAPLLREKYPQLGDIGLDAFAFEECEQVLDSLVDGNIPKVLELTGAYNEASFFDRIYVSVQILHSAIKIPDLQLDKWRSGECSSLIHYTDIQLIKFFGLLMTIDENLSHKYISQIKQNTWLLMKAPQHMFGKPEKGTDLVPFSESEIPFLAHGNFMTGFSFYDIEGLARHFQTEGGMTYSDPWTRTPFKNGDLTHMRSLFENGVNREFVPEDILQLMVTQLDNFIAYGSPDETLNIRKIQSHIDQCPDQGQVIQDFLLNFFYLGMYLRRWKGGDEPYPIREHQSGSGPDIGTPEEIEATLKITDSCILTKEVMDKITKEIRPLIWSLPLYQKSHGEERTTFGNIHACMSEVERGEYCIRFASGIFSYSAARYMYFIFKLHPPQFDFRRDEITIH